VPPGGIPLGGTPLGGTPLGGSTADQLIVGRRVAGGFYAVSV